MNDGNLPEVEFISRELEGKGRSALVVDSYQPIFYDETFQRDLLKVVEKVAYIVFDNNVHYYTHILHDQNPLSLALEWSTEPYTKRLFGLQNLILDEKFRATAKEAHTFMVEAKNAFTALLTFGGSDPNNFTLKVLEALDLISKKFEKVIVVIGAMYPFEEELNKFIDKTSLNIELHKNTKRMHALMLSSNLAFTSGGITTWELGSLGVPVIVLPAGEKESASARNLHELGWAQLIEDPKSMACSGLADRITKCISKDLRGISEKLQEAINVDGIGNFVSALLER